MSDAALLRELRTARRARRLEHVDWIDALYHVYLSALVGGGVTLLASSWIGDDKAGTSGLADAAQRGPGLLGLLPVLAIAVGLRSGSRGGPLALEAAEVRHVLLSPIDRVVALRSHALRQLRFALFVGAVIGGIGGQLAVRRLGGAPLAWVAAGAVTGAACAALAVGTALLASTWRLPRWAATAAALAILVWGVADAADVVPSPTRWVSGFALWPLEVVPADLAGLVAAGAVAALGVALVGGQSIEDLERRSSVVGQLRFAVTVQDLRTATVLRRQLAQDHPRRRPWLGGGRRRSRFTIWHRSWIGFRRFPAGRLARLVICSGTAALALIGTTRGTTPLLLVAAGAAYLAGLDVAEPMAQQEDQADRTDLLPVERGPLLVRYVPALTGGALLVAIPGAIVAAVVEGPMAALYALPLAATGLSGAIVSVAMREPDISKDGQLLPPEFAGMKVAVRTGFPLMVAVLGTLPAVVAARVDDPVQRRQGVTGTAIVVAAAFVGVVAWLRFASEARSWWTTALEQSQQSTPTPTEYR